MTPSSPRPTIRDVATRAGVSVATVSRVLNGAGGARPDTVRRVLTAVEELDYVANANARALTTSQSRTLGVILPSLTTPFFMSVADGIEEQATQDGYVCMVISSRDDPDRELKAIELLRQRGVDAIILTGGGTVRSPDHDRKLQAMARSLQASQIRLVLCARPSETIEATGTVSFDNEGGARAVTSHLLERGHRDILYLGGPAEYGFSEERVAGYASALRDHDLEIRPELISAGRMARSSVIARVAALLESGPSFTAVFAASDAMASAACRALTDAGRLVPDDVSVVGYNDEPVAAELSPGLTTVHVPTTELGRLAARRALHDPADSRSMLLDTTAPTLLGVHVVVRDSVRSRRRSAAPA